MKRRKLIGISTLLLFLVASVSFVTIKKNNKFNEDIAFLCSKNWNPVRQGGIIDSQCKINYYADHTYKLVVTGKPGAIIKGDTLMLGKWSVDKDKKIHILACGFEKIVDIVKLNKNTLVLRDNSDNKTIEYTSNYPVLPYTFPNPNAAHINNIDLEKNAKGITNKNKFQE